MENRASSAVVRLLRTHSPNLKTQTTPVSSPPPFLSSVKHFEGSVYHRTNTTSDASTRLLLPRMASHRLMISRIFPTRMSHNIRSSNFSTHSNGGRGNLEHFSYLGFDWSDLASLVYDLMKKRCYVIVPEGSVYLVERSRKYNRNLTPGLKLMIPFKDRVTHIRCLKVKPLTLFVPRLLSKDSVEMQIHASLFYKVVDPFLASYEVDNASESLTSLAEYIIRKNAGQNSFDELLHKRDTLNKNITSNMCEDAKRWGLAVVNFEMSDIILSENMEKAMMMEACKLLEKSSLIKKSEEDRDTMTMLADAEKKAAILLAEGEAKAEELKEEAKAQALSKLAEVMGNEAADRAMKFKILTQVIETFGKIFEEGRTIIYPK